MKYSAAASLVLVAAAASGALAQDSSSGRVTPSGIPFLQLGHPPLLLPLPRHHRRPLLPLLPHLLRVLRRLLRALGRDDADRLAHLCRAERDQQPREFHLYHRQRKRKQQQRARCNQHKLRFNRRRCQCTCKFRRGRGGPGSWSDCSIRGCDALS
ncbi:hypothetical protein CONPUDRAFT_169725 [Coniophora puteana RWD-64-598 SS2]|uniref:Uncharacterized protein n=1 Tax=Coniophora puteana (strain RWD-64-598) TaxID=741705 RepID=A0A5M3M5V7_CONPW|nr:uncharacterized protein CONPUDRAFT_169725 [Coniophora puteana RWD-64-598 SS2]EIW74762.1 hypothetical protein CONPUDRAFT_169725 [Coniophora puteana RWD-64-598 SS2]